MDTETTKPQAAWRLKLTPDEAAKVRAIEFNSNKLREDLAKQSVHLALIRNRAVQRLRSEARAK